ncbi:hypothetical protein E4T42_02505 [Aureobasidium subglaciale]|nr:hypothetical protein E4T42_02505 [Aureobasidium subglaciale]
MSKWKAEDHPIAPAAKSEEEVTTDRSQSEYRKMVDNSRQVKTFTKAAPTIVDAKLRDMTQYMAWVFTDTIATKADIQKIRDMEAQTFGSTRKARRGVYRGQPMFMLVDVQILQYIQICKAVRDDLGVWLPKVMIQSPNAARALPAINAAAAYYIETGDVRQALLVLAEAADIINQEIGSGKPPSNTCHCNASLKKTSFHACGNCLEMLVYESRQQDWRGVWICLFCQIRERNVTPRNMISKRQSSRRSTKKHGKICSGIITNSTAYFDDYRSKNINPAADAHLEGHTKYSPNLPSVDGIFAFYECNGRLRYHCKGNVAVTTVALNYMKHIHNPALQSHLSEFVNGPQTKEARLKVLEKATNSTLIRMKVPYKLKARTAKSSKWSCVDADILEWTSDRLSRSLSKIFSTKRLCIHGYIKTGNAERWVARDRERLLKIVRQIELRFNVSLPSHLVIERELPRAAILSSLREDSLVPEHDCAFLLLLVALIYRS